MKKLLTVSALAAITLGCPVGARANVVIDTVSVGNLGNVGELSGEGAGGFGPDRICGSVAYAYGMGRFECTTQQYADFLNAVAADDTYDLYNTEMGSGYYPCGIERTGSAGNYSYSVWSEDWANRPVNYVSWGDAARLANWLHNGQPAGGQDLGTTEDGSYLLDGATTEAELLAVTRRRDASWVIPSEDEWYKAAYHKDDGVTGNYWDYPTSSDVAPSNELIDPDPGNNATFTDGTWTVGYPYWRTEVGAHENSDSPYGTFDMAGNVWEWTEAILEGGRRGLRGGSFNRTADFQRAFERRGDHPTYEYNSVGFRLALIPEPTAIGTLGLGAAALLLRRRQGW
jgi:sulfatase modifying factor 1